MLYHITHTAERSLIYEAIADVVDIFDFDFGVALEEFAESRDEDIEASAGIVVGGAPQGVEDVVALDDVAFGFDEHF